MRFRAALWLALVVFTMHNIEEYFTMQAFIRTEASRLPSFAADLISSYTPDLFLGMLIVVTIIGVAAIYAGSVSGPHSAGMFVGICMVTGGLLLNGIHHLGASLLILGYSPGVYTSAFLLIPYSIYLCRKALLEDLITMKALLWSSAVGLILMGPIIFLSRFIAALVIS
ncbi:MAG: HXXEE domain-containing protein [Candidatus Saccharibacteria bacterium]